MGHILDLASALANGLPLILAGDFNVAVGLRQPGHRPHITRGEWDLLKRLREEFDLVPCRQTAHPGKPLASPWQAPGPHVALDAPERLPALPLRWSVCACCLGIGSPYLYGAGGRGLVRSQRPQPGCGNVRNALTPC
ncbi:MAG: hypothetical protein ABJA50_07510 [Chloroflexota bacterium]